MRMGGRKVQVMSVEKRMLNGWWIKGRSFKGERRGKGGGKKVLMGCRRKEEGFRG